MKYIIIVDGENAMRLSFTSFEEFVEAWHHVVETWRNFECVMSTTCDSVEIVLSQDE